MKRTPQQIFGIAAGSLFGALSLTTSANAMTLVNTELVLSIDTSGSIDASEYDLQIQGYIDAFNSVSIRNQISSLNKGVAVAVNTWSSFINTSAVDNFFHLTDAASIDQFISNALTPLRQRPGAFGTNIAAGIEDGTTALLTNDFVGDSLVIDVSGDGISFGLSALQNARKNAVDNGITINGLPIGPESIATYYQESVIGGTDAFIIPANDFNDFSSAVKTKIGREIATPDPTPTPTPTPDPTPTPTPDIESTPEPTSLLGLGLIGLAGAGAALKRKQRES